MAYTHTQTNTTNAAATYLHWAQNSSALLSEVGTLTVCWCVCAAAAAGVAIVGKFVCLVGARSQTERERDTNAAVCVTLLLGRASNLDLVIVGRVGGTRTSNTFNARTRVIDLAGVTHAQTTKFARSTLVYCSLYHLIVCVLAARVGVN